MNTPSPASASEQLVGSTIAGKYKIVSLLGEGGMGCVYVGEQLMGSAVRKVAIKTLHSHLSMDPQIRARFTRECGTVAQLEHPNTIQVFDFGTTEAGLLYIVMEFIQGKSVAEILEKEGPMPAERVLRIMEQVCGSLEEAHSHGIVHRDLKPDNVVICDKPGRKDWVEVLDFGIAKRSSETDPNEAKLTQQGMVLGTPPYMSPEQFTGQPIGATSDIYSLGIMTYEMLTGRLPFAGNTAWELASQHMTARPPPLETQPNGALLPPGMREAIMRCLEKVPEARFATVTQFYEGLRATGASAMQDAPQTIANAGRMKTEMAAPAMAPMSPMSPMSPAYGAPPQQQQHPAPAYSAPPQQHAPAHGAYAAPAASQGYGAPPAPASAGPRKSNMGIIIGASLAGLAVIGGIAAVVLSGKKDVAPPAATQLALTPTATAAATASATASATPEEAATLATLSSSKATPAAQGRGTGNAKPTTTGPVKPIPTPGAAKTVPPACDLAARFKGRPQFAQYEGLCKAAGGTVP
jgi:eukaryotic-like serine/threonine-protein kinase